MIRIESLIPEGAILVNPAVSTKGELIRLMVDSLTPSQDVLDGDVLFKDVMAREAMSPTYLGYGCAIPHAHSAAVRTSRVALAILKDGVGFASDPGDRASIVFLLVGPSNSSAIHLKLLSKIARFLHDADFRNRLSTATDARQVLELLRLKEES